MVLIEVEVAVAVVASALVVPTMTVLTAGSSSWAWTSFWVERRVSTELGVKQIQPALEGGDHAVSLYVAIFPGEGEGVEGIFDRPIGVNVGKGVIRGEWLEKGMDSGEVEEGACVDEVGDATPDEAVSVGGVDVDLIPIDIEDGNGVQVNLLAHVILAVRTVVDKRVGSDKLSDRHVVPLLDLHVTGGRRCQQRRRKGGNGAGLT